MIRPLLFGAVTTRPCRHEKIRSSEDGTLAKKRLKAFSDRVIAILIAIMVPELKVSRKTK
jgi:hypothetical protein